MKFQTPESLAQRVSDVASLPAIYERINAAVNNPSSSLADVARIISEDIGLTGRLLKLVNSAFFGFPSRVDTVNNACVIVGAQQLRSLALASSVVGVFDELPEAGGVTMDAFWRHSVGVAMASRALAKIAGERDAERFFVAGLLHDIGRLACFQEMPDDYVPVVQEARRNEALLHETEKRMLGYTHAQVGAAMMKVWRLPASLEATVAYHHAPQQTYTHPLEAACVHFGDIIAHAMEYGNSGHRFVPPPDSEAWKKIGLTPQKLSALIAEIDAQFEEIVTMILGH